jgi:hypothetical protein
LSQVVFARIRASCAEVARRARSVRIDPEGIAALSEELARAPRPAPDLDPAHLAAGDAEVSLAYVLTLDAINFGSGYFPHLSKRPGLSGYFTVATCLKERFEAAGPWAARQLTALSASDCAEVLGQDLAVPEVSELMGLYARALRELGSFLLERYAGRFQGPIAEADGCAARLVEVLASMPLYRDVAEYRGIAVPFYKRAQLTVADLAATFGGRGYGRFGALDRLTSFADNLVPHVLRREGALVYAPELAERIDSGELVGAGSPEEVEIRAGAVHAVELCVRAIRDRGGRHAGVTAQQLDCVLWNRGQRPELKAHPRHRTRTFCY